MTAVELESAAPTGLLERENELATAREWFDDVRAERGRMVLIEAPPGLGKSALIEHVREMARGDFNVLSAGGSEMEQELGWGVARSLFEPWLLRLPDDERAELLSGPASSATLLFGPIDEAARLPASDAGFAILHGLYWLAVRAAEAQPTLLVVDDAHWSDEPSLRLLTYLVGRIRDQRIGVLVAARSGEPGAAGLLAHLAGERDVTICEPAPLSAAAITTLIQEQFPEVNNAFCRRCWELTAGNPLGVREVLYAIAECPPAAVESDLETIAECAARSLSRSVLRRLASLSPEARGLADAMSVFDADAEFQWAASLAELEPEPALAALDQLERVDMLRGEDHLAFTHPLLRTSVYRALPRGRRRQLHRRAAGLLHAAHLSPECVAPHLLESPAAGDGELVAILRQAAGSALTHGVPASAARYLERALREPPSDDDRASVLAELGQAEASFAPQRAIEHLEAAAGLERDPERRAALAVELGRALHDAGRPEDACATFERGLAELQDDSSELATELEAWYLTAALLVPELVRDAHRRAGIVAGRPGIALTPAGRLLVSRSITVLVRAGGSHEQLIRLADAIYDGAPETERGGPDTRAPASVVDELPIEIAVAGALGYSDQYERAEAILSRAVQAARRVGWVTWYAAGSLLLGRFRLWTGPLGAIGEGMTGLEVFTGALQIYLPVAAHLLACDLIDRDEYDEADVLLARVEDGFSPTGPLAAWQHEARGRLAAARGEWARALEAFVACGDAAESMLVLNPAMFPWRSEAGLAALRLGRDGYARELIGEELTRAERFGAPRGLAVARRAAALIESGPKIEEGLASAAELLRGCGARVELAYTLVELGGAVRRSGRPTKARETLREALAIAEEVGARRAARLAREELQRAGGRAPAPRNGTTDQLTPSERRVAELAAQGRTNREIANELFVTVKAVEWHLGNAYRKLDIRGRGALGDALSAGH